MRTAPALAAFLAALTLVAAAAAAPPLPTEPAAPPLPPKYDVTARYSIDAVPAQRVPRFRAMLDFFKKQGFTRDEERAPDDEEENRAYVTLSGTVPGDKARACWPSARCAPFASSPQERPSPRPTSPCAFNSNWPPARGSRPAATFTTRPRCDRSRWTAARTC